MPASTVDSVAAYSWHCASTLRTVWVAVDEIEPKVSRVRVQARTKGGRGDIDLASEIDKQIYGKLITR